MLNLKTAIDVFFTILIGGIFISRLWDKELDKESKIILLIAIFVLTFLLSTIASCLIFFIIDLIH